MIKKFISVFLALSVLTGCSTNSPASPAETETAETTDSNALKTTSILLPETAELYPIGTNFEGDGITITLKEVFYLEKSDYYIPAEGKELAYCYFTIKNDSTKPYEVSPIRFVLRSPGEYLYQILKIMVNDLAALKAGTLDPGDQTRGYIAYEVNKRGELVMEDPDGEGYYWLIRQ